MVFHAFDPVTVQLSLDSSNIQHEKIIFELVEPFIEGFSVARTNENQKDEVVAMAIDDNNSTETNDNNSMPTEKKSRRT